jgi:hypothetical protein
VRGLEQNHNKNLRYSVPVTVQPRTIALPKDNESFDTIPGATVYPAQRALDCAKLKNNEDRRRGVIRLKGVSLSMLSQASSCSLGLRTPKFRNIKKV